MVDEIPREGTHGNLISFWVLYFYADKGILEEAHLCTLVAVVVENRVGNRKAEGQRDLSPILIESTQNAKAPEFKVSFIKIQQEDWK